MPRARTLLLVALVAAAPPASASYVPAPGFPWTRSASGGDTADAIVADYGRMIWVAGTTVQPATGRDVEVLVYSVTSAGTPLSASTFDRGGLDEGPPALAVVPRTFGGGAPSLEREAYVTFTSSGSGSSDVTLWWIRNFFSGATQFYEDFAGRNERAAPAIAVPASGSPFLCGTVDAGGVDQLWFIHEVRATETAFCCRVTATLWSGSLTESVTGRGVAVDGAGNAWTVGAQAGDLVLAAYTPAAYAEGVATELRATPAAGWPKRLATAAWDEPRALMRDVTGALWVAGDLAGDAALWRFDAGGTLLPGFPVTFGLGPGASLLALVSDGETGCFATGRRGGDLVVLGVNGAGALLPGFPRTETAAPDAVEGRGITLDPDGALWIAATVTAAAGTWGGTIQRLYKYDPVADPLPVAAGEVKLAGPGGAVLNPRRGEVLTIEALPQDPGDVTVRVLTLRGEVVRAWRLPSSGNRLVAVGWDGRDASGVPVAAGTYAIRVTGGGLAALKRAVVRRAP